MSCGEYDRCFVVVLGIFSIVRFGEHSEMASVLHAHVIQQNRIRVQTVAVSEGEDVVANLLGEPIRTLEGFKQKNNAEHTAEESRDKRRRG